MAPYIISVYVPQWRAWRRDSKHDTEASMSVRLAELNESGIAAVPMVAMKSGGYCTIPDWTPQA